MTCSDVIQLLVAIGTLILAVVALFGDWLKHALAFLRPSLHLSLLADGELTKLRDGQKAWFFHLKVTNRRRWTEARGARVVVIALYRYNHDSGEWAQEHLSGPLQLTWRFPQLNPLEVAFGPARECDLGFLPQSEPFELSLYVRPHSFDHIVRSGESILVAVQAIATNAESRALWLRIDWDGQWSESREEVSKHLRISPVEEERLPIIKHAKQDQDKLSAEV